MSWKTKAVARSAVLLIVITLPVFAWGQGCVGIANPGFETGDFTGWATLNTGASAVIGTYADRNFFTPQTVYPYEGKKQARLTATGVANAAAVETFLGVAPNFFVSQLLTRGAAIKQTFQLDAGDRISLAYYWVGRDYFPFNDAAFITVQPPNLFAQVFQVGSIAQYGPGYVGPVSIQDPWGWGYGQGSSGYLVWPVGSWDRGPQTWAALSTRGFQYEAPLTGLYTFGVVIFDQLDIVLPSDLLVDNLTCIDPIPIPLATR
jgi:hypothetical protein